MHSMKFFSRRSPKSEPQPVLLPEQLGAHVAALLGEDRLVEAVKLVRQQTELDLVTATLAVRHRQGPTDLGQDVT